MSPRVVAALALIFSGLTALVYEILWVRLLGFVFGTTSEAIGTVLAVFFGGMALGNWIAARNVHRIRRPLRLYAILEISIGVFALCSLPLLQRLDALYALVGTELGPTAMAVLRVGASAAILLPPTIAMGATLPVVARGVVDEDGSLGRWTGILYGANTLGSVVGAYLSGFWWIPGLGLTRSLLLAAVLNAVVGAFVWWRVGARSVAPIARVTPDRSRLATRRAFLLFFGVSGFVAIGYEMVWSKLFGIVMEGTLYGFAAVLSTYLLGIGLGSILIAPRVDRIVDLPRAFAMLHVAIAAAVAAGMAFVPSLPYLHGRLGAWLVGTDPTHALYLLAAPLIIVPAALFGMAFPVLMRIYSARSDEVAAGVGTAVAVNTCGSILASLSIGFWANVTLGMDATLLALLLLDLGVAALVLLFFQETRGRERFATLAATGLVLATVGFSYGGVHVESVIAGRSIQFSSLADYDRQTRERLDQQILVLEGKNSVVTVSGGPRGRDMRTNGMPEAGVAFAEPNLPSTVTLLGILPYVLAPSPERALVIGLGGGNTVDALRQTALSRIEVVELEGRVARAVSLLHEGRRDPLDDARVELVVNDGRNELLLARHRGAPSYDLIVSQPSHPWIMGAANLFTSDFFALAREGLRPGGICAIWVNGFRTTPEALISIAASFEQVFPGSYLVDISGKFDRSSLLLVGGRDGLDVDPARMAERLRETDIAQTLALHGIHDVDDLLARFEAPAQAFADLAPGLVNTDDNAFVETRIPRQSTWEHLDFSSLESRLPDTTPLWPVGLAADAGAAAAHLVWAVDERGAQLTRKLDRLLKNHGDRLDPYLREVFAAEARLGSRESAGAALTALRALADREPTRPEALRAAGRHLARRERAHAAAGRAFAAAFERSGDPQDAYDAARALDPVDPAAAWSFARALPRDAERFPRRALFEARVQLADPAAPQAELRQVFDALVAYRATREGRTFPGLNALLAGVATRLGEDSAARAFADADHRERSVRAAAAMARVATALGQGDVSAIRAGLDEARRLVPGDPALLQLEARAAAQLGEPGAFEAALSRLEQWSASLEEGQARSRYVSLESAE